MKKERYPLGPDGLHHPSNHPEDKMKPEMAKGARIVTRFGGHYITCADSTPDGWIKVERAHDIREYNLTELRPWVEEIHGPWEGKD